MLSYEKRKPPKPRPVALYGSSGNALAVRDIGHAFSTAKVVAYIDDFRGDQGVSIDGVPILTLETWRERFPDVPCAITIGDPRARRSLASRVREAGGSFSALYQIKGWISPNITVGEGSIIAPTPTYVGPQTTIGEHVIIMQFAMVNHDCVIGDYVTICPSVNISGHVIVEDDVFIGVGATIVNGSDRAPLRIGRGALISAGAVVLQSVSAGAKLVGNPAEDAYSLLARRFREKRHGLSRERERAKKVPE